MDKLVYIGNEALYLILYLSLIPITVATVVGITVALFQAVTHLQEQTLPFGIKLIAVCMCLYFLSGWFGSNLLVFTESAFHLGLE